MRSYKMRGENSFPSYVERRHIPVDLQVKIEQAIQPYTIFPLLDGEVSGSGTLVTIDGVHGILTACRVVQNWRNSKPKDQHPKRLGIVPDCCASTLVEEPLEHFVSFVTNPGESETFGPDLAFVRIPSPSGFFSCLIAKKSFWNLTRSGVVNRIVFMTRTSPMASCGLVAEKTVVAKSKTDLNQYVFLWTEPRPFERETYDYVDLRSRRSLQPETPNSFGGVSGSGLWRFSLAKVSESEIKPFDFQLAGVAFYQLPDTDDGVATVRFHGPRSIYELLLPQVRSWLG